MEKHTYGILTRINTPYEEAVPKVMAALQEEGFGVLTEIDVKATLKKKLDADFRKYVILGVCNPKLAYQALQVELGLGLLLPCNVVVYEEGEDQCLVSVVDPMSMVSATEKSELQPIAEEATERLTRALNSLENAD